jgi:hypothetical protein
VFLRFSKRFPPSCVECRLMCWLSGCIVLLLLVYSSIARSNSVLLFCYLINFFPMAQQPLVGQGLLIIEASRSHSDTPQSVRLLWTSDQADTQSSTCTTHNTHRRETSMTGGIRNRSPSKRAAADPRLRPRGQGDRR